MQNGAASQPLQAAEPPTTNGESTGTAESGPSSAVASPLTTETGGAEPADEAGPSASENSGSEESGSGCEDQKARLSRP